MALSTPSDSLPELDTSEVPAEYRREFLEIAAVTDGFCTASLNEEYLQLCRAMAVAICQAGSPVKRGKRESWACGIVYSVGWVNFLTDPSQEPHVKAEEIAKWFGISMATMHNKSKVIREGLDLVPFDPDFCLRSRLDDNPLVWMIEIDGFIIDMRHAPRGMQIAAYENGLIPYVPSEHTDDNENSEPPK